MADDVFSPDGSTHDPSLYHTFSDKSGCYLDLKSDGEWSYKDDSTWHVANIKYLNHLGTQVTATLDVHFDGKNYDISNISGTVANPGYEEFGASLEEMESDSWAKQALVVAPELLE